MRDIATFSEALFNFILWVVLFISIQPIVNKPYLFSKARRYWVCFLLLVFCLYPFFGGDYFHYIELYNDTKAGYSRGLEEVYIWIIRNISFLYTFFRLLVWGAALWLTISAYKRIAPLDNLAIAFFSVLYLPWFSYARVSLAMALIFWGVCLISKPNEQRKILSYLIGLAAIVCSVFFHRTAPIAMIALLGSLLLRNPTKKSLILVLISFPIAVYLLKYGISEFMSVDLDYDSFITERKRDSYLNDEDSAGLKIGLSAISVMGIGPYISVFFTRAPLLLVGIAYFYAVVKGYFKEFQTPVKYVSSYTFVIILIAIAFSLDLGFSTYAFYYRTLNYAMIPSALFLSQIRIQGKMPVLFRWIYYSSIFGVFYTLVYTMYCSLVA